MTFNLTNPMMKGYFRELLLIDTTDRMVVPDAAIVTGVIPLVSKKYPVFGPKGKVISLLVLRITEHKIVVSDLTHSIITGTNPAYDVATAY